MMRIIWRIVDKYICIPLSIILWVIYPVFKIFKRRKDSIKNILLIKLAALGDTVLILPTIRALHKKFSQANISILATKINADIFSICDEINKVFIIDPNVYLTQPIKFIKFIYRLNKEKFDLVIDFEQRVRISSILAYFTGAQQRIGFRTKGYFRHYLYTTKIIYRFDLHDFDCLKELAKPLIGDIEDKKVNLKISPEVKAWAAEFLEKKGVGIGSLIIIHPGCGIRYSLGAKAKEWPRDNFVELANVITEKYNFNIGISAGSEELNLAEYIASKMRSKPLILFNLNLIKLAAVLKNSSVLVTGDTGVMHLAAAIGVPIVALFGPTDPKIYRPLSDEVIILKEDFFCSPCLYLGMERPRCKGFLCIKRISVESVLKAVVTLMKIKNEEKNYELG